MNIDKVVLTCEHGGNRIPAKYLPLFSDRQELLFTHRGYDIGAPLLFDDLAKKVADASYKAENSRLLVELNRSLHAPDLFSEITAPLPPEAKEELLRDFYFPYRSAVEGQIRHFIGEGNRVLHLSLHTFTPKLHGQERQSDVGLLFDPERESEKRLCTRWKEAIRQEDPDLVVRTNYPYLGTDDGLTTSLRTLFPAGQYLGVELEVNQKFYLRRDSGRRAGLHRVLRNSLQAVIFSYQQ